MKPDCFAVADLADFGAMGTMDQRGKIQEERLYDEARKRDGSLPLIDVDTVLPKEHAGEVATTIELIHSTEGEKQYQVGNVLAYGGAHNGFASNGLKPLQQATRQRENCFAALIETVKTHSLGQISHVLYEVGGEYRRIM